MISAAIIGVAAAATVISTIAYCANDYTKEVKNAPARQQTNINKSGNFARPSDQNNKEFEAYIRDAVNLGYIDPQTHKESMAAYTKLRNNNYDYSKLSTAEAKSLGKLYDELYSNDTAFQSLWNQTYSNLPNEDKIALLRGSDALHATSIPAPAYLDESLDMYQKEVEPVRRLTNQEVADLMNINYDFNSILQDYNKAAEGELNFANWQADLLGNNAERDNENMLTDYLSSIRNVKSQAVKEGITNGARASAEVLANLESIKNKDAIESQAAVDRFNAVDDAILNKAQTKLNTLSEFMDLQQMLGNAADTMYDSDVDRIGSDWLANATFRNSDGNLLANRIAANNRMRGYANYANAVNTGYANDIAAPLDYFEEITLPAFNGDYVQAVSDYIDLASKQNTGYRSYTDKYGAMSKNGNK